jgi:hypothetical protein
MGCSALPAWCLALAARIFPRPLALWIGLRAPVLTGLGVPLSTELGGPIRNQVGSRDGHDGQVINPAVAINIDLAILRSAKHAGKISPSLARLGATNLHLLAGKTSKVLFAAQRTVDARRADLKLVHVMNHVGHVQGRGKIPTDALAVLVSNRKSRQNVRRRFTSPRKVRWCGPVDEYAQNPPFAFPIPLQLNEIEPCPLNGRFD